MKKFPKNNFVRLIDKIFGFILIAFFGFTTASVLFIKFGALTWVFYWNVSKVVLPGILFMILFKLIIDLSGK
jgi:hypothetical protein